MFPTSKRLDRTLFTQYFKSGTRYHQAYCTMVYTPASQLRVAVVAGKKVAKRAVDRNRLRRRVYATAERYVAAHPATTGVFIIILKPAAIKATRQELQSAVTQMFAQITNSR